MIDASRSYEGSNGVWQPGELLIIGPIASAKLLVVLLEVNVKFKL